MNNMVGSHFKITQEMAVKPIFYQTVIITSTFLHIGLQKYSIMVIIQLLRKFYEVDHKVTTLLF